MSYQVLQIKDIFVGSIDAKDDVTNKIDNDEFIENFIIPPNLNIDEFLNGKKCFIEGYKGTGKTALLHYMSNHVVKEGGKELFILFKSDYKNSDRDKLENLAINMLNIDKDLLTEESDFEYIWRWIILNNIVKLNIKNNYEIFEKSHQWEKLEKAMKSLIKNNKSISLFDSLPFKLRKIGEVKYSVEMPNADIAHTLGISDIEFVDKEKKNVEFKVILDKAMEIFLKLVPKSVNSYIFIDELEAFYEEKKIFKRDLRMIRDLILTVKYFNDLFSMYKYNNLKIICAVRTEVLESIQKNIAAKEINKIIYSFRQELKWNYANTTAYQHPIIQIWINRIKHAEKKFNNVVLKDADIMKKWFTNQVNSEDIIPYILDNSWHKPRDIIRFLQAASNVSPNSTQYDQSVFNNLRKEYSKESWKEIYEELNITYKPFQISLIKEFLMCFKRYFTFEEAKMRAEKLSFQNNNNFLKENITEILKNLYSVGCIGNMSVDNRYFRWKHKGDDSLVIDDSKLYLFIHSGLWSELSLFYVYIDESMKNNVEVGQTVICRVKRINKSFAYVDILDTTLEGSIHLKYLSPNKKFIKDIKSVVKLGDVFKAKVFRIDEKYGLQLIRIFD
ncbi:S1 RNA-binding domain-containing protein [Clostridium autoethanogenum]|uniref:S1 RNA-binding domain-containing protein n=1 Tax=Clostridium autoethanogenum TaxID=84023 RepID=A0A3M0ST51_9CLOT|nr:S1 RNA-binding domain-containing protein [Clostridium autoethanogenum]RMD01102.1 S1 RNA-binding domain-containing protein [Clostridium autoethanogenum]